jgi:hypothetical protein
LQVLCTCTDAKTQPPPDPPPTTMGMVVHQAMVAHQGMVINQVMVATEVVTVVMGTEMVTRRPSVMIRLVSHRHIAVVTVITTIKTRQVKAAVAATVRDTLVTTVPPIIR